MRHFGIGRVVALLAVISLLGCQQSSEYFGKIEPLEGQIFRFNNGAEPEYMDPQKMTGQPDGRIAWSLFEGLTSYHPEDLSPQPGIAESWDVSEDGKTYTFHIRKDARWSNGDPLSAEDIVYSWRRFLDPATAAQYAYLIFAIHNAKAFASNYLIGTVSLESVSGSAPSSPPGSGETEGTDPAGPADEEDGAEEPLAVDPVAAENSVAEVYLEPELDEESSLPTGRLMTTFTVDVPGAAAPLGGTLVIEQDGSMTGEMSGELTGSTGLTEVSLEASGKLERDDEKRTVRGTFTARDAEFELNLAIDARVAIGEDVALFAPDEYTVEVQLDYPVPYFLALTSFYPLSIVHRPSIEKYDTSWTLPENIVSNGPFRLIEHSIQNRIVMVRNEQYWDRENVRLEKIIAYPVELYTTGCDLYKAGEIDLNPSNYIPLFFIPTLREMKDYYTSPYLAVYFYRVNVTHPVLKNKKVRKALAYSLDRDRMVKFLRAGQLPAEYFVPDGIRGYESPHVLNFDIEKAKKLLAEAGYSDPKKFPTLDILYNTTEQHKQIAEVVQEQWKTNLGIDVRLKNQEWKVYLKSQRALDYDISRAGWIGDYADPVTFLDMWLTGGGNNNTGYANPVYDQLLADANVEQDFEKRMAILRRAEEIVLEDLPIIPLYIYTTFYLKKPYVRGYYSNIQDIHLLKHVWIDHDWRDKE